MSLTVRMIITGTKHLSVAEDIKSNNNSLLIVVIMWVVQVTNNRYKIYRGHHFLGGRGFTIHSHIYIKANKPGIGIKDSFLP